MRAWRRKGEKLNASGMMDIFVAVSGFWYLPSWTFQALQWLNTKHGSMEKVDRFAKRVVERASAEKTSETYSERLLDGRISESETRAEYKNLIFVSTDSTGMNLATVCALC
jgi:hypothetical protein